MPPKNFAAIRRKLLVWYRKCHRDLPWRRSTDPYAIWISEIMLQQTQVKTVLPYYRRFLRSFPDVEALARAPLGRVLHLWSGLGYYRRAENLKIAARQVVRDYRGKLPEEYQQLRGLAGIGDYTAGAILSIAFGKKYPAIDGNVRRVLGRLCSLSGEAELRAAAMKLVSGKYPGDLNQALMELGATICSPDVPKCSACPLKRECLSRARNRLIVSSRRTRPINFTECFWPLAVVRHRGKILLRRRANTELLPGFWELPGSEIHRRREAASALRRQLLALRIPFVPAQRIGEIRHSITYRRIRAPIYLFDCPAHLVLPASCWRWVTRRGAGRYPVSSMTQKALALLADHETHPA